MTLSLTQSLTAVGVNTPVSFAGVGGTSPYVYSVIPYGAGGTINASTGMYTAPSIASSDPLTAYDTIQVADSLNKIATARVLVGTSLLLLCDIIQNGLGLTSDRVWIWDQKIFQPTDSDLYIAVSMPICKVISNINELYNGQQNQFVNMRGTVDIDFISRGPAARDRKEELILALNSVYAEQQQEANSFYIGKIPPNSQFVNLSNIDGSAIPYRYKISINMMYVVTKVLPYAYFDTIQTVTIDTNP